MKTFDQARQLQERTKKFAARRIRAFASLPKDEAVRIIGRQLLRSGTSCRSRFAADFISKISVVTEEADETLFWFELLIESELIKPQMVDPLMVESLNL